MHVGPFNNNFPFLFANALEMPDTSFCPTISDYRELYYLGRLYMASPLSTLLTIVNFNESVIAVVLQDN